MKTPILRLLPSLVSLLLLAAVNAGAQETQWTSDFKAAQDTAAASNKYILMDFTGSDWCPWCIKMDKEVLHTKEFKDYADKNLVLMLVDFPQRKQLVQTVKDQNDQLQKKYAVEGFPTFILVDKDGKVLGQQVGYLQGGPAAFITLLEGLKHGNKS